MDLQCSVLTDSYTLWPTHKFCYINNVDIAYTSPDVEYTFSGSPSEKMEVSAIHFYSSPEMHYIPLEIFKEYPNLMGLRIYDSNFPILKNTLFSENFTQIRNLYLDSDNIQVIESHAFQHLVNLEWISLNANEIQTLSHQIFRNNFYLIYINLNSNQIKSIHPSLFKHLGNLKYLEFTKNHCANKDIGCENCTIPASALYREFYNCFANCSSEATCFASYLIKR
jgi:hypothetical protein